MPSSLRAAASLRGRGDVAVGQAVQLGLVVHHHRAGGGGRDQPGVELRGQGGLFDVELAQGGLVGVGQLRTGAHELLVLVLDQALLLRVQVQGVALVVEALDAREQLRIQVDLVLVRGQLGRDLFLDLLTRIVGIGLDQAEEDARDAGQGLAAALHRLQRVGEGGRLRVVGDLADLGQVCCCMPSSKAGR
ncbi:hypothetical protein QE438_002620 [Pseudoxanthomonas sp. SORGH_AS 997]|nr:hypothetical protein [Pseudoxanthomonas sp. SORGH_AS_0997]